MRTFRHQLILLVDQYHSKHALTHSSGLAISDLVMALNFLSSTATNLSGRFIGASSMKSFCLFNGFMTQFFVVQSKFELLVDLQHTYDYSRLLGPGNCNLYVFYGRRSWKSVQVGSRPSICRLQSASVDIPNMGVDWSWPSSLCKHWSL